MGRMNRTLMVLLVLGLVGMIVATALAQEGEAPAPKEIQVDYFKHYFVDGGWVVWFIELPMSIAMVALSVMFLLEFRRSNMMPEPSLDQIRSLLEARQYREAIDYTANDPAMVSNVVHTALAEASNGYPAMERSMEEAIDDWASRSLRKIEHLNTIGNIAPMVGLFGTVFGMIQTFQTIVSEGGVPNAASLASGISVALVTTLWGLAIAIPALSVFANVRNRVEGIAAVAALRGQELLGMFNPTAGPGKGSAPATAPRPAAPKPASPQAGA